MSLATLNNLGLISARADIPKWGAWYAEATLDGEHVLSGRVTLQIADLSLSGTIISGGPSKGRSSYRIGGGAASWGKTLKAKSYADDGSTKRRKVFEDAAREAGETLVDTSSDRVGPNYTRPAGPAASVLDLEAPHGWYVDEAGITRVGARAAGALVGNVTRITPVDLVRGRVVLAAASIATILPGVVVDELTAVDVQHVVSAESGLRSTVWGAGTRPSGGVALIQEMLEALDPDRKFRGVTEYTVLTTEGSRLNLKPTQVSTGMPELLRVPVRPGVAGCEADIALGARVLVGFVNSDPGRPFVCGFEDADGGGFLPTSLTLLEGVLGVARMTDPVQAGPFAGTIVGASSKVRSA